MTNYYSIIFERSDRLEKSIMRLNRNVAKCRIGGFIVGGMLGFYIGAVIELKRRVDDIEDRLKKLNEMVG